MTSPGIAATGCMQAFLPLRPTIGGHHGLVLEKGAQLAHQQQLGGGVLRGLIGECFARARHT